MRFLSAILLLLISTFVFASQPNEKLSIDTTKKVIIIGIDGVRSDMIQDTIAPNLFQYSNQTNTYFNPLHKTEKRTWSGPNWSSICTGVHLKKHKARGNLFIKTKFKKYPHFFSYINSMDPANDLDLVSIVHWRPINGQILAEKYADFASKEKISDEQVKDAALKLIQENSPLNPEVIFLHFDDVDHAGHANKFSSYDSTYRAEMNRIDGYVGEILNALESRKASTNEDWLILIVSDHGGVDGNHGNGYEHPEVGNTIFFMNHTSLEKEKQDGSEMVDLAPTVLEFMGLYTKTIQKKMDGKPLLNK